MAYTKRPASVRRLAAIVLATAFLGAPACRKTPPSLTAGNDLAGMDTSVAAGDDFNAYANGGWIKATPIPADKSSYGIFARLADETRKQTLTLIEEAAKAGSAASGDARKIADFYSSFMDEAAIESKGIAPLQAATRRHRGHRGSACSGPRAGRAASRGRRPSERHELRDRQPLRSLWSPRA